MAKRQPVRMLIYEEEMKFIEESTLKHPKIETGGDVFGLWRNESEVVVTLVTGPGRKCRRTTTSFFQDRDYLSSVGNYLIFAKGLCNIGEWHSHHSLNLPEPSHGDRSTVWRNLPGSGLQRFLLVIATIKQDMRVEMNGFMFTAPANGSQQGGMFNAQLKFLPGPNPYRKQPDVMAKLHEGAEIDPQESDVGDEVTCLGRSTKDMKKHKKHLKQQKEREKKEQKKAKKSNGEERGRRKRKSREYSPLTNSGGVSQNTNALVAKKAHDTTPPQQGNSGKQGSFFQDNPSGSVTDLAGHESSLYNPSNVDMSLGPYMGKTLHFQTRERSDDEQRVDGYNQPYSQDHRSECRKSYMKTTSL